MIYLGLEKGSRFHHPKKGHKELLGVYESIYNIQGLQILIKRNTDRIPATKSKPFESRFATPWSEHGLFCALC